MDITSLYTVIPNDEGLLALKHFFDLRIVKEPSSETLLRLAELVLTLNCFSFADSYFKQINGVAMGTKMEPSYANLFVGYVEHKFFNQYNGPKLELYRRYIDDCIGATSSSREDLNQFITAVNSFHPALKYTWEISDTSLAFPFIRNVEKKSGPKRSIKITDQFTCTSANVIYCITCTLCKKSYIGETGRRLGDRFRGHLRDVEKDDQNASKPIARHFKISLIILTNIW